MKALKTDVLYDCATGKITRQQSTVLAVEERTLSQQVESEVVGLYPAYTYQTVEGFGCAMTESACWLLARMEATARTAALKRWFGPGGVDARFIRIPLDSCDYSLSEYQAVADPITDPELATFSMERNRQYILPMVKEAVALAGGKLSALLSPWSPPAQWKTPPEVAQNDLSVYGMQGFSVDFSKPGRCFGGRLRPEYYGAWAAYLVKYVQAYLAEGVPVTMLSVQNEASAATSWDSCLWSAEEESRFLRDYLYPAMKAAGLTERVGLYIWDHNKERMIEHIEAMLQNGVGPLIEGFAYHWYSGDHFEALSMLGQRYPEKILMHSESCGLHIPGKSLALPLTDAQVDALPEPMRSAAKASPLEVDYQDAVAYAHDIIGDLNHGMQRWIDWNLCVDRAGGPRHVPGGFAAPLVAEEDGTVTETVSYAYINCIAQTVLPGSVRIGVSGYSPVVEAAAVRRPDGTLGVLLLNRSGAEKTVSVRVCGYLLQPTLPAAGLTALILTDF